MMAEAWDDNTETAHRLSPLEERLQEAEMQCRFERAKRIELAALIGQFIERAVPLVNDAGLSLDPREFERRLAKPSPVVGMSPMVASTEGQDTPQSRGGMDVTSTYRQGMLELEVTLDVAGRKTPIAVLTCLDSVTGHYAAVSIANLATVALIERHPLVGENASNLEVAP